jgi:FkbH-like protein
MHDPREARPVSRSAQLKSLWQKYQSKLAAGEDKVELTIGLAASFTVNGLVPFLGGPLLEAGLKPDFALGPYNQIFQTCLDPRGAFGKACDVIVLLYRLEDIIYDDLVLACQGDAAASRRCREKIELLISALTNLASIFTGTTLIDVPPFPTMLPSHARSLETPTGLGHLHRVLTTVFVEMAGRIKGVRLFDLDALQREAGLAKSFDVRPWYLYRQPYPDSFLETIGGQLARIIVALRRAPKKCILLDCDNTLWGGIVGEDGIGGIQVGEDFPGTPFRDLQRLLLHFRQRGIFLAITSKNNEADVRDVFDKHPGMLLKPEHISAWQVNWQPKAENAPLIAKALNIGLDSLVFIDDNPMEIEYMRTAHPQIECILLPEETADIFATVSRVAFFDQLDITDEDRARTDMMLAEQERESLGSTLTKEEFQRELGLRVEIFTAKDDDLDRATQLINKTNQFNLTTIRRSFAEVRTLAKAKDHTIFGIHVSDKFGTYGLTGVMICAISPDGKTWTLDTLLLSCRVLGRGVETALLVLLAAEAGSLGAETLNASFIPTKKNAPAATFLPDHGFQSTGEQTWSIPLTQIPTASTATLVRNGIILQPPPLSST